MRLTNMLPAVLALFIIGCATRIAPPQTQNPAPSKTINSYRAVELALLEIAPEIKGKEPTVEKWIQERIDSQVKPVVAGWGASKKGKGTLVLKPYVEKLKFISTGERIWGGALAGGSAVQIALEMKEKDTGTVIGRPIFYQHANAFGGAYSFGSTDRDMLSRVVSLMASYLQDNYDKKVGGRTGSEGS